MHPIPVPALCSRPWVSPRFLELSAPTRHRALPLCLRPSLPHPAPAPSVAPGFDLMAAFGLVQKEYASIRGVAMEPSALGPAMTFTLFKDAQLTRRARWEGRGWAQQGCHTVVTLAVVGWPWSPTCLSPTACGEHSPSWAGGAPACASGEGQAPVARLPQAAPAPPAPQRHPPGGPPHPAHGGLPPAPAPRHAPRGLRAVADDGRGLPACPGSPAGRSVGSPSCPLRPCWLRVLSLPRPRPGLTPPSAPPAGRKSLTYFSHHPRAALQEVTFDLPEVRRIFYGSFHKVLEGSRKTQTRVSLCLRPCPAPQLLNRPPRHGRTCSPASLSQAAVAVGPTEHEDFP